MSSLGKLASKLLTGAAYSFVALVSVKLIMLVNSIIVARFLGPTNLGIFSILIYLQGIVFMVAIFGIPGAIAKFTAEYEAKDKEGLEKVISTSFSLVLVLAIICASLFFVSSGFIANELYHTPILAILIMISAFTVTISAVVVSMSSLLQGFQRIKLLSKLDVVKALISLPIFLFLILRYGLVGAVLAGLAVAIISLILFSRYAHKVLQQRKVKLKPSIDRKIAKKISNYALPNFLADVVIMPALLFGVTILALKYSFGEVGLFRVANSLSNAVLFIPIAVGIPLFPMISSLQASDEKKIPIVFSKTFRIVGFITLPITVGLGLFSKIILPFIYGAAYYDAWHVLFFIATTTYIISLTRIGGEVLGGLGKMWQILGISVVWMVVFVSASYYFIGIYGLIGLGLALLLAQITYILIQLGYLSRLNLKIERLAHLSILGLVAFGTCYIILTTLNGIMFYVSATALILTIVSVEYLLLTKEDRALIYKNIKSLVRRKK